MYIATLDSVKVGNTVVFFRHQKAISQEVLSGLADIGRSHLSAIERGERKPTLETLYRICVALDIKLSTFCAKLEELL
ncbi:MAG: helix-turn-helix transcriptional regulator [Clostridia bacterium]|nr:helix-turn-helix transcriptional regulator [Clostridia bacterium]